jgi:hypothetical protein
MDKQLEELYGLVPEGMFSDVNQFKETIDSEGLDVIYGFIPEGMFSDVNQFKETFSSVFQPQEELTPEMMETGQRNAAPAYAMTEEKYAAEKKSAGESPLQMVYLPMWLRSLLLRGQLLKSFQKTLTLLPS